MNEKISWVVITGASGGVGLELSKKFLENGYGVIGIDIKLDLFLELKKKFNNFIVGFECDLSQRENTIELCDKISSNYPNVVIWINNAGIVHIGPFENEALEDAYKLFQINFDSVFFFTRFWLEKFRSKGCGKIVNIASLAGHFPMGLISSYAASKHAVVGLTRSIQLELKAVNSPVKLLLVSPGFINTALIKKDSGQGFPKQFEFILDQVGPVVDRIFVGIMKNNEFIQPTRNGFFMQFFGNLCPWLSRYFSVKLIAKRIKPK